MRLRPDCDDPCLACEADMEDLKETMREATAQMLTFGATVVEVGKSFARALAPEEHADALNGGDAE